MSLLCAFLFSVCYCQGWVGLGGVGLGWVGLGWIELGHVGAGWVGFVLCRVGLA